MFAILAAICFFLGLIGVKLGISMLYLGLLFLAIAHFFDWRPWPQSVVTRRE